MPAQLTQVFVRQVDYFTSQTLLGHILQNGFVLHVVLGLSLLCQWITWYEVSNIVHGALCWSKETLFDFVHVLG